MLKGLLDNLRNKPHGFRMGVAVFTTLIAAVILVPLWFWNARSIGFGVSGGDAQGQTENTSFKLPNPLEQLDQGLKAAFSSPVSIQSVKTVDDQLEIMFQVKNSTFANLVFPPSQATLESSGSKATGDVMNVERVATREGTQFVPIVAPGESLEGVLYFPKVFNGNYVLKFSKLRYEEDNQTEFEQLINIEVTDAYLPRT